MGTEFMDMIERLRGQKLTSDEKDMFIRMKEELRCSDEDAIWQEKLSQSLNIKKLFTLICQNIITEKTEKDL